MAPECFDHWATWACWQ